MKQVFFFSRNFQTKQEKTDKERQEYICYNAEAKGKAKYESRQG
jgi:hypothetical protein